MKARCYLGLGSNLGDRLAYLCDALVGLFALDPLVVCSSVYETAPVGGPAGQGPYLNAVAAIATDRPPLALLEYCQSLEALAGRVRSVRNGPRTLDVDVLYIDGVTLREGDLLVPHPRLFERAFVLAPLIEIAPEFEDERTRAVLARAGGEVLRRPELTEALDHLFEKRRPPPSSGRFASADGPPVG